LLARVAKRLLRRRVELDDHAAPVDRHDAIQRGAQVCGTAQFTFPELVFDLPARADVENAGTAMSESAVGVVDRDRGDRYRKSGSILSPHLVFEIAQPAALLEAREATPKPVMVLRRQDIGKRHSTHDFITRVSEPSKLGVVDLDEQARAV